MHVMHRFQCLKSTLDITLLLYVYPSQSIRRPGKQNVPENKCAVWRCIAGSVYWNGLEKPDVHLEVSRLLVTCF